MRTGCPFLAQKNYVCFDEIQHVRYWYNGILKTSHEHSTMQFDNIFFLCRSFIFSVHCCVYINILNTFLHFCTSIICIKIKHLNQCMIWIFYMP